MTGKAVKGGVGEAQIDPLAVEKRRFSPIGLT
jgi:hypothetical protein